MNIETILHDRPIAYHPVLAKMFRSATVGIYLSQLLYWSPRSTQAEGWFYKTQKDMEGETGLSRSEQDTARKKLVSAGMIEVERRGVPATLHFRVRWEALQTRLQDFDIQFAGSSQTGARDSSKPDDGIPANQSEEIPQTISETTTETTSTEESVEETPGGRKRRKQPRRIVTAAELLNLFRRGDMEYIVTTYSELDITNEALKWADHWEQEGGVVNAKVSFRNWLENARRFAQRDNRNGVPSSPTPPVSDRVSEAQRRAKALTCTCDHPFPRHIDHGSQPSPCSVPGCSCQIFQSQLEVVNADA